MRVDLLPHSRTREGTLGFDSSESEAMVSVCYLTSDRVRTMAVWLADVCWE